MRHAGPGGNMRFSDIVLDDAKLSLAAKGVFVTIGLLGNGCTVASLEGKASDGSEAVRSAVQELVDAGYVSVDDGQVHIRGPSSFGIPS